MMWKVYNFCRTQKFKIIFFLFLIIGIIGRIFLASKTFNLLGWDSHSYNGFALELLNRRWGLDCCDKNAGYGVFLFLTYSLFGANNFLAVYFVQILIDIFIALVIYFCAKKITGQKSAYISSVLYLINPLTASYTGLILSETITMLIIILIAYLCVNKSLTGSKILWITLGALLGAFLFIRVSFYYFPFIFIIIFTKLFITNNKRLVFTMIVTIGFITASLYSLIGFRQKYGKVSIVPPYSLGTSALYANFYNDRYPEFISDYPQKVNPKFYEFNLEYHTTHYLDLHAFKKKYTGLFWEKFQKDWPLFFRNSIRNVFWMWDKEHLYAYEDHFYPQDKWPLRIGNIALFMTAFIGLIDILKKKEKSGEEKRIIFFTCVLFLYITLFFSLISNETRHSLSFYPLLFFWSGNGIFLILNKFQKYTRVSRCLNSGPAARVSHTTIHLRMGSLSRVTRFINQGICETRKYKGVIK